MDDVYERLFAAVSRQSDDSAIRFTVRYEPVGGEGEPVFPPTSKSAGPDGGAHYLLSPKYIDRQRTTVVTLDSPQSQANRCEVALLESMRRGETFVPHLVLESEAVGGPVRLTSLEAPHRSRDAYFRDAMVGTVDFDATGIGRAMREMRAENVVPAAVHSPADLAYGVWDSHRKRRVQTKIPRAYTSEMYGVDPLIGSRAAGRTDPMNLGADSVVVTKDGWLEAPAKGAKAVKLSELGHGMIPPTESLGGVSVLSIHRTATISMAQLAALRFGDRSEEFAGAVRVLVAALALLGDRLAFADAGLRLRSGCDLVVIDEQIEWVVRGRGGRAAAEPMPVETPQQALELFRLAVERAREAGLEWADTPVVLQPNASLQAAIERSFAFTGIGSVEDA